jgi:hypothetical protein
MEDILVLEKTKIFNDIVQSQSVGKLLIPEPSRINPVMDNIRTEGGEDFYQYIQWLRLSKKPDLLALSSTHHYYYESNDLKRIKTLVNLKKLNNIKHLESFLHILVRILPQKANFIGTFKSYNQDVSAFSAYQPSNLFDRLINYIDSRTDRSLTKKDVSRLLEEHNLKVVDITDINGMTYFYSQK